MGLILGGMSKDVFLSRARNKPRLMAGEAELGIDLVKGMPNRGCKGQEFQADVQITNRGSKDAKFRILNGSFGVSLQELWYLRQAYICNAGLGKGGQAQHQNKHVTTIMLTNSYNNPNPNYTDGTSFCDKNPQNNKMVLMIPHGVTSPYGAKPKMRAPDGSLTDAVCSEDMGDKDGYNKVKNPLIEKIDRVVSFRCFKWVQWMLVIQDFK